MTGIKRLACAVFLLATTGLTAAAQTAPPLQVISFTGELVIQAGNQIVVLKPGMPGYSLPQNQEIAILAGEALLLAGKTLITVVPNDSFTYVAVGGEPRLWVHAGAVKAVTAGRGATYGKGDVVVIGGTVTPPPAPSPPPVEAEKTAEETPEQPPPSPPSPLPAPAQPPAHRESPRHLQIKIELHPYYSLKEVYDDNIFLVAPDRPGPDVVGGGVVGAWITSNNPGFNFLAPLSRKHKINGSADLNAVNYSKHSRINDTYDTSAKAAYGFTGRDLAISLSNAYQNNAIPAFSELVARQRHWQDTAKFDLERTEGRHLRWGLDAQHVIVKYLNPALAGVLNHYEDIFGARAGITLKPKTKAFLSYHRGINHYSAGRSANSKSHSIDANVEGELAPRLTGSISAGLQSRLYDAAAGLAAKATAFQTNVSLNFEPARGLMTNLRLFRNFSEATFGTNRYYISTGGSLSASWTLRRLVTGVNGGVEVDLYPDAALAGGLRARRRDDLYSWGVTEDYRFREWLKAGFSFTRLTRFSTFSRQFDYADDRTGVDFKASF